MYIYKTQAGGARKRSKTPVPSQRTEILFHLRIPNTPLTPRANYEMSRVNRPSSPPPPSPSPSPLIIFAEVPETPPRPRSMAPPASRNSGSGGGGGSGTGVSSGGWGDAPLARALFAYLSSGENQLSFLEGDLIALMGEWWVGG